jgi:hypothetical protein
MWYLLPLIANWLIRPFVFIFGANLLNYATKD